MFTAVLAAAAAAFPAGPADTPRLVLAGRSVHGRPISAIRTGDATALRTVLVIGCLHGNECAGTAVVRELRRRSAPRGTQVWTVRSANPDGEARGTRQNAHGVDLNRNFPRLFKRQGRPFSTYDSGPHALSEPESRSMSRLIRRLRPDVTVWYHQAMNLVDLSIGADARVVRRYGRLARLPVRRIGFLPGVATLWQNHRFPDASAFVVELPAGQMSAAEVTRHVRAVHAMG
jgi:protein MpaA